jgi:hypothetical protein
VNNNTLLKHLLFLAEPEKPMKSGGIEEDLDKLVNDRTYNTSGEYRR